MFRNPLISELFISGNMWDVTQGVTLYKCNTCSLSFHCSPVMRSLTITILCLSLCLRPGSAIKIRGKGVSSATGSLSTVDHTEVKCDYVRWRQDSKGLGKLEQIITNILNVMYTNIYNIFMYNIPKTHSAGGVLQHQVVCSISGRGVRLPSVLEWWT